MRSFSKVLSPLLLAPALALAGPVDINSADAGTLAKELKGIGKARAEAIVAYRAQHGPFKSADDLSLVKGIPQYVINDNREDIRVDRAAGATRQAAKPQAPNEKGRGAPTAAEH